MAYLNNNNIYLDSKKSIKYILNGFYKDSMTKKILVVIKKCKFYIKKTNFIKFIIKLK